MWHYTTHFSRPGCMETPTLLMHKADAIPVKKMWMWDYNLKISTLGAHFVGLYALQEPLSCEVRNFHWILHLTTLLHQWILWLHLVCSWTMPTWIRDFFLKLLLIYLLNLRWYFAGSISLSRRIFMIQMTSGSKSTGSKILKISMEWSTFLTIKKKCF